jgi:hypothetical protein
MQTTEATMIDVVTSPDTVWDDYSVTRDGRILDADHNEIDLADLDASIVAAEAALAEAKAAAADLRRMYDAL